MSQLGLEFIDEIKTTPPKYRDWDILEELPEGWNKKEYINELKELLNEIEI